MGNRKSPSPLRRRAGALVGAAGVVVMLWLLAVLAVKAFVTPPPTGAGEHHIVNVVRGLVPGRSPNGASLELIEPPSGGNPFNSGAWGTILQILLLITAGALVVAGVDRLRRNIRRSRQARAGSLVARKVH